MLTRQKKEEESDSKQDGSEVKVFFAAAWKRAFADALEKSFYKLQEKNDKVNTQIVEIQRVLRTKVLASAQMFYNHDVKKKSAYASDSVLAYVLSQGFQNS